MHSQLLLLRKIMRAAPELNILIYTGTQGVGGGTSFSGIRNYWRGRQHAACNPPSGEAPSKQPAPRLSTSPKA